MYRDSYVSYFGRGYTNLRGLFETEQYLLLPEPKKVEFAAEIQNINKAKCPPHT